MRRIAVVGTVVALMVIMLTAGIAGAQSFPGADQYDTAPPPADILAFIFALIAAILEAIFDLLAGIFGGLFGGGLFD